MTAPILPRGVAPGGFNSCFFFSKKVDVVLGGEEEEERKMSFHGKKNINIKIKIFFKWTAMLIQDHIFIVAFQWI